LRRHHDSNHLAFELGKPGVAQHQVVVHGDKSFELRHVEGVSDEHVRHETEFVLAFLETGLSGIGFAPGLFEIAFAAGLADNVFAGGALPPLMACNTGWSLSGFAIAALPAALAVLLAFGISRPLISSPIHRQSTMFWQAAIRSAGQHFIYRFRELRAAHATFCTPVADASPNGGLLSTGAAQNVKTSAAPRPILARRTRFHGH
jgi:hypothetical protein